MDGYPTSYAAFKTRLSRWTRGDWQIIKWLNRKIKDNNGKTLQESNIKKESEYVNALNEGKETRNPLNLLSKYKILNNLVKSLLEPIAVIAILFLIGIKVFANTKIWPLMLITFLALTIPSIMEIVNKIIYKKEGESGQKTFYKSISGVKASLIRAVLEIGTLPDKAFTMIKAITKTIYRMCISKKHLLEWTTAEEAEKNSKTDIISYYKNMWPNLLLGLILLLFSYKSPWIIILSFIWIITPGVMTLISKKGKYIAPIEYLSEKDKEYMLEIGRRTWSFFKENLNQMSNFLPPDNYQEDRKEEVVYRTSPTNIGLGLLAVVSSYDLGYENLDDTVWLLSKMLDSISKLQKWNGHLYNWYDIKTLKPLVPKYVSTVDSGNFVGYLYTLKKFLQDTLDSLKKIECKKIEVIEALQSVEGRTKIVENAKYTEIRENIDVKDIENGNKKEGQTASREKDRSNEKQEENNGNQNNSEKIQYENTRNNGHQEISQEMVKKINIMLETIDNLINSTDFKHLYSEENRIFSIGFNVEDNTLTPSYYDLLASEARQASLIAIAKKDVPAKHWYNLSRTLTVLNKYKGLISWSGTAFEYLMPNVNIPKYPGSIISESSLFAIYSQQEYAKKLNIPWGISEAAFNLRDLNNNYQYKAFGIPWLGLKRGLADEMVVSSYGTMLAVNDLPQETIKNLKELEKEGMYDRYGFYESIDYTPSRMKKGETSSVVKTYMAHHQGLILLCIDNLFNRNILQKRFMGNPEIQSVEILLEERMPENIIITKEQKEKVEKVKTVDYETYAVREYNKPYDKLRNINVISNEDYSVVVDQKGDGYSKYKDIVISRFKQTNEVQEGIHFFFKNIKTKRIWSSGQMNYLALPDKYTAYFSPDSSKFVRQDGGIETTTKICVMPNSSVEIRRVELKNLGNSEETIEVNSYIEAILSSLEQDYSHKAFNNLFLTFEFLEDTNTILAKRNARNDKGKDMYMAVNLYTENETVGELEYELDKEKFVGRQNVELPIAVQNSVPLTRRVQRTTDPIIAMRRTIKILPGEKVVLNLIISVSEEKEEAINLVKENMNNEKIIRNMNLAKAKVEAESMYLGVKAKDIEKYQNMLKYLIYQNPLKLLMYKGKIPEEATVNELWKYGISGDLPILVVKIKDISDIYVVKDCIKAYEYFRVKNIKIDLVILNEEKKTYENYVYEEIVNSILDSNLAYMQNQKGGIFVLSNLDKNSKRILEYRANLLINAHLGNISRQLKDYEEEYLDRIKNVGDESQVSQILEEENEKKTLDADKLKYYNEYGGFSIDGSEYLIRVNKDEKLPTVWSNIMANENFGTVVTEGLGGYTWYKNSRLR